VTQGLLIIVEYLEIRSSAIAVRLVHCFCEHPRARRRRRRQEPPVNMNTSPPAQACFLGWSASKLVAAKILTARGKWRRGVGRQKGAISILPDRHTGTRAVSLLLTAARLLA
jgi:hypothetical protein